MPTNHTISNRDAWFIDKHLNDPVTHEPFKVGDIIVVCARCKSVHYEATWGMNPIKSCSNCESNEKLNYDTFSSILFQPYTHNNPKFNILVKKIPSGQELKLFNKHSVASMLAIVLSIFLAVSIGTHHSNKDIEFFNFAKQTQPTIIQNKIENLKAKNLLKVKYILQKHKNLNFDFKVPDKNMSNILISFEPIKSKLKEAKVGTKFERVFKNAKFHTENNKKKFDKMLNKINGFFDGLFKD